MPAINLIRTAHHVYTSFEESGYCSVQTGEIFSAQNAEQYQEFLGDLQLIFMTRGYPKDPRVMQRKVHAAFARNRDLKDEQEIEKLIVRGEYIVKELEALYKLKKYRTMKHRYYEDT